MFRRSIIASFAVAAGLLAGIAPKDAAAQGAAANYPNKPIHIVVGFSPGGGNDIFARLIAQQMSERLKQPVIVDNKPGAGAIVATEFVSRAQPDGYTLLVGASGAMTINAAVYKNLRYDTLRDFTPLSEFASFPLILSISAKSPLKTVKELVEYTKANPGKSNYASSSTAFQIATELFKLKTGAKMENVAYKGSGDSVMAVISNEVLITIADTLPVIGQVQAGQLRAMAVLAPKRSQFLPDVPTMEEQGVPDVNVSLWSGLFAPKKTPAAISAKLSQTLQDIVKDPEIIEKFKALAVDPVGNTSEEFAAVIDADIKRWKEVNKTANIHLDD